MRRCAFAGNNINIIYLKIDAQVFNIYDIWIIHLDIEYMGLSLSMQYKTCLVVYKGLLVHISKMMKYCNHSNVQFMGNLRLYETPKVFYQ